MGLGVIFCLMRVGGHSGHFSAKEHASRAKHYSLCFVCQLWSVSALNFLLGHHMQTMLAKVKLMLTARVVFFLAITSRQ